MSACVAVSIQNLGSSSQNPNSFCPIWLENVFIFSWIAVFHSVKPDLFPRTVTSSWRLISPFFCVFAANPPLPLLAPPLPSTNATNPLYLLHVALLTKAKGKGRTSNRKLKSLFYRSQGSLILVTVKTIFDGVKHNKGYCLHVKF